MVMHFYVQYICTQTEVGERKMKVKDSNVPVKGFKRRWSKIESRQLRMTKAQEQQNQALTSVSGLPRVGNQFINRWPLNQSLSAASSLASRLPPPPPPRHRQLFSPPQTPSSYRTQQRACVCLRVAAFSRVTIRCASRVWRPGGGGAQEGVGGPSGVTRWSHRGLVNHREDAVELRSRRESCQYTSQPAWVFTSEPDHISRRQAGAESGTGRFRLVRKERGAGARVIVGVCFATRRADLILQRSPWEWVPTVTPCEMDPGVCA